MVHEIKFLLPLDKAESVLAWARRELDPDPHGNGDHSDEYLVQSIYFDTPQWHVFRKIGSYGRAKYRVRRYNDADWLFLERKLKRGGIVRKRRSEIGIAELPSLAQLAKAGWYDARLNLRQLLPTCYIEYHRVARQKITPEGMLRLTVDRALRFDTDVQLAWPAQRGEPFLKENAILELKYPRLPALAKRIIEEFNLNPGPASKYRMALRASKLAPHVEALDGVAEADASDADNSVLRVA